MRTRIDAFVTALGQLPRPSVGACAQYYFPHAVRQAQSHFGVDRARMMCPDCQPTYVAFSGDHSGLMTAFLKCITTHSKGRTLPHLEVLCIGQRDYEQGAQEIVESWGARFTFVSGAEYNRLR